LMKNGAYKHLISGVAWFTAIWLAFGMPLSPLQFIEPARAALQMIALWDTAYNPIPTGWSSLSGAGDFYLEFLRGDAAASVLGTGGDADGLHQHALSGISVSTNSTGTARYTRKSSDFSCATSHSHSVLGTSVNDATLLPQYRDLVVISYDAGVPTTLPINLIVGATSGASMSASFTAYSTQNTYYIRGNVATGSGTGSNTHTHTAVSINLNTCDTTSNPNAGTGFVVPTDTHTHSWSGASPTGDHTPPSTGLPLYRVNTDGTPLEDGMIAFFNGAQPGGWISKSESGGDFYQKYIYGSSTYTTGTGSAQHTHTVVGDLTTGVEDATELVNNGNPSTATADSHTHALSGVTYSNVNNNPIYRNVVVAEYAPPDISWAVAANNFQVYSSPTSVTWNDGGTLKCQATLTDTNANTSTCTGNLAAETQYRVQVTLENNDATNIANFVDPALDVLYHRDFYGSDTKWGGTSPTITSCAFYDAGADDNGSPACAIAGSGGTDLLITNTAGTGNEVVIGASGGVEGFSYLITTAADAATNATSYMDATIDLNVEDSSKIGITIATDTIGVTAPASVNLASGVHPGETTADYTFASPGENIVITDSTSNAWSLTVSATNLDDGSGHLIDKTNIFLRTNNNLASAPTTMTETDANITETNNTGGIEIGTTAQEIVGGNTSADGTYNIQPTFFVTIPPTTFVPGDYASDFTFTVA
jgi:hypothetical protein